MKIKGIIMAKRIVEPFRIKMVENIRIPSREEREAALKKRDITHFTTK